MYICDKCGKQVRYLERVKIIYKTDYRFRKPKKHISTVHLCYKCSEELNQRIEQTKIDFMLNDGDQ